MADSWWTNRSSQWLHVWFQLIQFAGGIFVFGMCVRVCELGTKFPGVTIRHLVLMQYKFANMWTVINVSFQKVAWWKLEYPWSYLHEAGMEYWTFVFCPLLLILSRSVAQDTATLEELNAKMLKWHNEIRTKVLNCKLKGQPQAKVMPNLVSQIRI